MPEIQLFKVRLRKRLSMAVCAKRLSLLKQRPKEKNNSKFNLAKCCCSSNDVFRRLRTRWQQCSGTDDLWSHLKITPELELSLWLKDQRQRTAQQGNVNHVGNAELQKARSMMRIMCVKRQSKIISKTTLNSRTTRYRQVQRARSKSMLSLKVTKRLREISSGKESMH